MRSHLQKLYIYLQGSIAEKSEELTLRLDLLRHDVEYDYSQRTDILMFRPVPCHNEYVFFSKRFECRKLG